MLQIVVDNTVEETYLTLDEVYNNLDYGTIVEFRRRDNKYTRINVYGIVIMNEDGKKGLLIVTNNEIPSMFKFNTRENFYFVRVPENTVLKLSNK